MVATNITQAQAFCIASACLQVPVSRLISGKTQIGQRFFSRSTNLIGALSAPFSNAGLQQRADRWKLPKFLIAQHRIRSSRKRRGAYDGDIGAKTIAVRGGSQVTYTHDLGRQVTTVVPADTESVFEEPTQLEQESNLANARQNYNNWHSPPGQTYQTRVTNSLNLNGMHRSHPFRRLMDRKLYTLQAFAQNLYNLFHSARSRLSFGERLQSL